MQKSKTKKYENKNGGFTLLISIVVTSILLLVSFVVVNIALKQLILSYSGQESQHAFYNADSGTECAIYWDVKAGSTSAFDPAVATTANCNGQTFSTGGAPVTNFTLNFAKGCAVVSVNKSVPGQTTITSKGYNTCTAGASRKFERGITITY